jgi:hypothetical protein
MSTWPRNGYTRMNDAQPLSLDDTTDTLAARSLDVTRIFVRADERMRVADSDLGRLHAVRDAAAELYRLGGDGPDNIGELSNRAVIHHGLDADAVQAALTQGMDALWDRTAAGPSTESPVTGRDRPAAAAPKQFALIALDDIETDDGAVWLIDEVLPAGPAFHLVWGPPKSLKSFGLMDAYLHVAAGTNYVGREVLSGAVVYVTSEGVRGIKHRLIAMRRHLGIEGQRVPFYLLPDMPNLGTGTADARTLISAIDLSIPAGTVLRAIVIDTVRRATPGKDENAAKDMSQFIENCGTLADRFQCVVSAVHHSPRSGNDHGAGSNALDAAIDAGWRTDRNGDQATFTVAVMKDGEQGATWSFSLQPVQVGKNKAGQPIMSCGVNHQPDVLAKPAQEAKPPRLSKADKIALRAIKEAIGALGEPAPASNHIPSDVKVTTADRWRDYAYRLGISDSDQQDTKRKAFKRAYQRLIAEQHVGAWDGWIWVIR